MAQRTIRYSVRCACRGRIPLTLTDDRGAAVRLAAEHECGDTVVYDRVAREQVDWRVAAALLTGSDSLWVPSA